MPVALKGAEVSVFPRHVSPLPLSAVRLRPSAYATAVAARFFWTAVTEHHSYVIGGNADREYFSEPDTIADHITEQTCEHCNTYNMLKLTDEPQSGSRDSSTECPEHR